MTIMNHAAAVATPIRRPRTTAERPLEREIIGMKKQALIACLAGAALGLGMVWIPRAARADLTATEHAYGKRECGYNNLFCEAGSKRYCVMCGSGHDITCVEQRTCDELITP
jgi:hypothetical protein